MEQMDKQGILQCSFLGQETTLIPAGKMKSREINWEEFPKELVQWEWKNEGIRDEQPPLGHLKILFNTKKTGKCFCFNFKYYSDILQTLRGVRKNKRSSTHPISASSGLQVQRGKRQDYF